ncbi:MAG: InlB B-repeat-containing protein [Clostridia bacterium]|nr:InlB B-repeat-containing protein [Clostridia bacterium]
MKKLYKGLLAAALAIVLCLAFVLSACGGIKVTFVITDSDSETVTVDKGSAVDQPEDPTREGYVFSGWYADENCTEEFDFSTEITEKTSVYAGWLQKVEGYDFIYYMWNYSENGEDMGQYKVEQVEDNKMVTSLATPTRDGYYLRGWYTDAACTTEFVAGSSRITGDVTLYALWYPGTTFEAEYTDLYDSTGTTARDFHGYSNNQQGVNAVMASSSASNGYYIAGYYQTGEYLYFTINSDTAVSDAALYITAAMEYGWDVGQSTTSLSYSDFTITVNGIQVKYNDMVFDMSSVTKSFDISPFATFYLGSISLNAGTNTIKLEMTNETKGQGGTQDGKGCLVDCITIYTNATLTWTPETDNIED